MIPLHAHCVCALLKKNFFTVYIFLVLTKIIPNFPYIYKNTVSKRNCRELQNNWIWARKQVYPNFFFATYLTNFCTVLMCATPPILYSFCSFAAINQSLLGFTILFNINTLTLYVCFLRRSLYKHFHFIKSLTQRKLSYVLFRT